jgi:hypothetical protein
VSLSVPHIVPHPVPLREFCYARAHIAGSALVIVLALRDPQDWRLVREGASLARVRAWLGALRAGNVRRLELPGLAALHFVFEAAAGAGRGHDLSADPLGRAFAQRLLDMPVPVAPN